MKFVHIAGTNGKGSVSEYIYSILMAAGVRAGCFTSPHLISPAERMRLNGHEISEAEYDAFMAEAAERKLAVNDTLFAHQTAAALLWFERNGAEYAVMETGLGGRLDPTNCILPSVAVLTSIDYDHMELLGNTIEQIAEEKCGIIKPGVSVVSAAQRAQAVKVIVSRCKQKNSPLRFARPAQITARSEEGQTFLFEGEEYSISAIGIGQPGNAALAILAAKQLGIDPDSIKAGIASTRLKCRAQYIKGDPDIILDGGHNAAAVKSLLETLDAYFSDRKKVLLFACMKDKEYETIIKSLKDTFERVIATRADEKRGEDPEKLCSLFSRFTRCSAKNDVCEAYSGAKEEARRQGAMLVVCGSFYLAGRVLQIISG